MKQQNNNKFKSRKRSFLYTFSIFNFQFLIAIAAFAQVDRSAFRGEMDFRQERTDNARETFNYNPAITKSAFRETAVTQFRNMRDADYTLDDRFTTGVIANALEATKPSNQGNMTISEIADSIWNEAAEDSPRMMMLDDNMIRHTYIWYLMNDYKDATNLQKQKQITKIKEILKD